MTNCFVCVPKVDILNMACEQLCFLWNNFSNQCTYDKAIARRSLVWDVLLTGCFISNTDVYTFLWYLTCSFLIILHTFSALTLLAGWQEGHLACKSWVVRYWHGYLCGARCKRFAYGPSDVTATASSLVPVKSRMVYLSGASLPRLSWEKGLLNGCSSSCFW